MYWHYEASTNKVVVSNFQRTMFSVVAKKVPERTVMIHSDTVALSTWPRDKWIRIGGEGNLVGGGGRSFAFAIADFANGRFIDSAGVVVYDDDAPKKPGWELVN